MICEDARELFPALVDGDIGLTERVPLEAHLSGCRDCQNALEVLRTSEPPPPPAWWSRPEFGFVTRGYEAARSLWRPRFDFAVTRKALDSFRHPKTLHRSRRPVSPHARPTPRRGLGLDAWIESTGSIVRGAWIRLQVVQQLKLSHLRLPAALAAMTIGAVGVFSYRAELDGAFRRWVPSAPSVAEAPPPTRPPVVAYTEPPPRPELPPVPPLPPATSVPAPSPLAPPPASMASEPSSPPRPAIERPKSAPPKAKAKESAISSRATTAPATKPVAAAPAPPPPGATRGSLDVVGKLVVKNRGGAERDLAALVARAGGTTVSRQRGPHVTVIEAVVPNPSYGRFAAGLNQIGSWQIEAGRASLPDPVRVTVRLAE